MRKTRSLEPGYFEGLYTADPDPWGFETSAYEKGKYAATLAALGEERAAHALEVGCSIGVLTRQLAEHCDRLLGLDVSETALDQARKRCADLANVEFALLQVPRDPVPGSFDLIVLSEVAYYWDDGDLALAAEAFRAARVSGGRILLVHWLGETDYPKTADEAVEGLRAHLGDAVTVDTAQRNADYRLDLWRWA
ncbi:MULTISPECIES: SAM-dependent methyltransferase [Caulobacter]|uniref:NodS family protein n=1 Tax=Caulobacter endophyticus TaxID=2172652 RepID=A0A2T9KA91_9CAUL|nr:MULTISPECIES: SAM-dependent methyltransferase [Caulobacter]PVM92793.1 NodS family protein [Caulobacter endophyticus]PXA83568.1 methyltransferase domain-containing protein [Caulobacter sp. D5]PXA95374.1 methyltransferase domain-containing protein [Caulobacter sp. D4A]